MLLFFMLETWKVHFTHKIQAIFNETKSIFGKLTH